MPIKFDHAVKYNGKYYMAGELIEEKPAQKPPEADVSVEDAKGEEMPAAEEKPAQKPTKGRKKGDA